MHAGEKRRAVDLMVRHGNGTNVDDNRRTRNRCVRMILCLFACCFLLSASVASADESRWVKGIVQGTNMRYPADFNMFSFTYIRGVQNDNVTFQHVEGPVAAGGSLIMKSFALNYDNATAHPVAAVAGGDVTFDWGGTAYGDVYYGGDYLAPPYQITYTPKPPYTSAAPKPSLPNWPIDFVQARHDMINYADLLSALKATSGEKTERGPNAEVHFVCSGTAPLEVFEINDEHLNWPSEIWFENLEADPVILINVRGDFTSNINYSNFRSTGGNINPSKILWNFSDVTDVNMYSTGFKGSLLAPRASVWMLWNNFSGTLVANSIVGSAELYHHPFEGYDVLQNAISTEGIDVLDVRLASEFDPDAPGTVGIVTMSIDSGVIPTIDSARIRFRPVGVNPGVHLEAPVDLTEPDYRTLLLGMKPDTPYWVQVIVESGGITHISNVSSIVTEPLPTDLVDVEIVTDTRGNPDRGFLVTELTHGENLALILDADGDIVWWYRVEQPGLNFITRAAMSHDAKDMWLVFNDGKFDPGNLLRVSMDTLDTQVFPVGASHDVTAVDNDTIAYLNWGEPDLYPSIYTMNTNDFSTNEIFESYDVPGYVPWNVGGNTDITKLEDPHLNAVHYYPALDLYSVGDRAMDIFVIEPDGDIVLRLSQVPGADNYDPLNDKNHGHQLLYDDTGITGLLYYANLGGEDGKVAVVEYQLAFAGGQWIATQETRHNLDLNAGGLGVLGDVQRLPNGHTMATDIAGNIIELDDDWNEILRLKLSKGVGYATWRPSLYGPPPY